jgi:hypothetical protein
MSALGMLVELIGYSVARAALPALSLGWIHVEPFSASPQPLRWPCYRRDGNQRIELRQAAASWIGLAICVVVLLAIALVA